LLLQKSNKKQRFKAIKRYGRAMPITWRRPFLGQIKAPWEILWKATNQSTSFCLFVCVIALLQTL
jgi:hypothetical protein